MQQVALSLLWYTGLLTLARRLLTGGGRFVLEFHNIVAQHQPQQQVGYVPGLTTAQFAAILQWLAARFDFLTVEDFLTGARPGLLLTFDDGLAGNVTQAIPLLEQYNAPAVFFVTTQHVHDPADWLPANRALAARLWPDGRYDAYAHTLFDGMSAGQLANAGRHPLVTIGAHTVTHPFLTQCSDADLQQELAASRRYLQQISGQTVDLFAYPAGDYDDRVVGAVRAAGYRAAFVELSRGLGHGAYEIPRVGLYRPDPAYLGFKLSGLHQPAFKECYA